eukprot:TRINITY_DN6056_c7_g1_i1.p1 TRINITY_DN6056_c7_g1~~TRINITY_DN6056_c7_g1_i1.p1  ORF type:complete len:227 (+),score=26.31 TRINITY_DN6056_c7_g1_i1:75-683(+)
MVDKFIKLRNLPNDLARRIRTYFNFVSTRDMHHSDVDLVKNMPNELQQEVVFYIFRKILENTPFFKGRSPHFIVQVVLRFRLEVYSPGDCVVKYGDVGERMYFIVQGSLEVRIPSTKARENTISKEVSQKRLKVRDDEKLFQKYITGVSVDNSYDELQEEPIQVIQQGHYFGEYSCLTGQKRSASVYAIDYCEIYSLSREDL